jgi:hypothetical protein
MPENIFQTEYGIKKMLSMKKKMRAIPDEKTASMTRKRMRCWLSSPAS